MVHFGFIFMYVGVIFANFEVRRGAQLEPKGGLEAPGGPLAPPRGTKELFGSPRVPFWLILVSFWGAKLEPKVGLEAPDGPPGSPEESQGSPWSPRVPFWSIWGSFWGHF